MKKTVVIGGGAAGLMAAATAAKRGNAVILLEKNERPARKVVITGKGRCNVTNNTDQNGVMRAVARNPKFLFSALDAFSPRDTMALFESLGVPLKTERGNRVFPVSDKAMDIADALVKFAKSSGVKIISDTADRLLINNNVVGGVQTVSGNTYSADSVIIATGGLSYPLTGSTGDGYRLAESAGHTVVEPVGSLVPIVVHEGWCSKVEGLSLRNVTLTLLQKGKKKPVFSEFGEMVFTGYGISGPLALSASAHIARDREYEIKIDLKPALDEATLDARILRDFSENLNKDFSNSLSDLLPRSLIPVIVSLSGIQGSRKVNSVTREERRKLMELLKGLTLNVTGLRPVEEAIITRGGVNVKEISPSSMESKLCSGLFFAGEVIDVDAYTGGYNLQIAFSTGVLAGNNC